MFWQKFLVNRHFIFIEQFNYAFYFYGKKQFAKSSEICLNEKIQHNIQEPLLYTKALAKMFCKKSAILIIYFWKSAQKSVKENSRNYFIAMKMFYEYRKRPYKKSF